MKAKQLLILLALAAAAGAAWYYVSERNRGAWSNSGGGGGKVIEFPVNDVARLKIKDSAGEVNLVKKDDAWVVEERAGYPASFEQVSGFLRKVWELKTVQEVKVGPSQMPRLELVEPGKGEKSGTLVECDGADGKPLAALLLGKKLVGKPEAGSGMDFGGMPKGRYVKALNGAKVSLVSDSLDNAQTKPERWLSKDFVKVESPKSIAVAGQTDAQKWTVTRESAAGEWKLADAKPEEKLDSSKTFPLGNIFSSPSFEDVLASDAKPADTGLDKPTVATIETFDGFRYELKIGKATGDNFPVLVSVSANLPKERTPGKDEKPEDKKKLDDDFAAKQKKQEEKLAAEQKFSGRAYLVARFTVEALLKDRAAYLPEKPAEPAPTTGAPVPPGTPAPPVVMPPAATPPAPPAATPSAPPATTPPATTPPATTPPATTPPAATPPAATPPAATPPAATPPVPPAATPTTPPAATPPAAAPAAPPAATPPAPSSPSPEAPAEKADKSVPPTDKPETEKSGQEKPQPEKQ